jgi:hypothetical protein
MVFFAALRGGGTSGFCCTLAVSLIFGVAALSLELLPVLSTTSSVLGVNLDFGFGCGFGGGLGRWSSGETEWSEMVR